MLARPLDAEELAAYLRRIGLPDTPSANRDDLARIVAAHARSIAFEDLAPFSGHTPDVETPGLVAKLVHAGRGGWCFEQNLLLAAALQAVGFSVTGLAGRVVHGRPPGSPPAPRQHMLLRVDLMDGPVVVDVGFGGMTLTGVLALDVETEQPTPHGPFRVTCSGRDRSVSALVGSAWQTLYTFDLCPQRWVDYDVSNWYLANHPASHFRSALMIARPAEDRRYALSNRRLSVHHLGGPSEHHELADPSEIRKALEQCFLIDLSTADGLDEALRRLY
ncbi:arylamine N-acetyltransferase family protein [Pseudonocardia spinosispora]|uniref:arylamine N-acetyltransferase family protein n=1 Tax=Pseudonocardia spinosispora TaxID=103441 RepID=UPI000404B6F8|nr:arylamine N-acetyltransferase [Pseudonocardia spinosispora]